MSFLQQQLRKQLALVLVTAMAMAIRSTRGTRSTLLPAAAARSRPTTTTP